MSVSTIGSNASNIADLINQRRQSLQAMAAAVQSGDLAGAQQSLAVAQTDTTSIQAASPSSGQATNPYRSSLATDLSSLSSALQSGDQSQATAALSTFQTDLSAATGASQATSGAHHGHHHHGGGGGSSENSSQQIADALFSPNQSSTDSTLGTDASSTSGDVLSQLLASLDSKQS